jgi:hypothetical protein
VKVARALGRRERQRPPHPVERAIEDAALGHDADDGVRRAVEQDGLADERLVGAELRRPQPVAENNDALVAKLVLVEREGFSRATEREALAE